MTAAWWDATREHRLTVQACRPAATASTRPGRCAPAAGRPSSWRQADAAGTGTVDTFTVVHRAPRARRRDAVRRRAGAAGRGPGPARPAGGRRRPASRGDRRAGHRRLGRPARRPRAARLPTYHPPRRPDEVRARRGPARVQGAAAHVRRPGDRPGRPRVGAGRSLPDRDRRRHEGDGALRHHRARRSTAASTSTRSRSRWSSRRSPAAGWASPASSAATRWPAG